MSEFSDMLLARRRDVEFGGQEGRGYVALPAGIVTGFAHRPRVTDVVQPRRTDK
ncbi:MAG: hypothetical protein SXV54_03785 [Chloroflexota bacterium]|nr:hypothetical protein [Chloroflexota bacterium]